MRPQHMTQPGRQSPLAVLVLVVMVMAGTVIMAGVMAARVWAAHNAQDACETLLQHLNHSGPGAPASESLFRPAPGANPRDAAIRARRQPERTAAARLPAITPIGRSLCPAGQQNHGFSPGDGMGS